MIRIFLTGSFDIAFAPGRAPGTVESFEVDGGGRAVGSYGGDSSLSLESESDSGLLDELARGIARLSGIEAGSEDQAADGVAPVLEHVRKCDACGSKPSESISHAGSQRNLPEPSGALVSGDTANRSEANRLPAKKEQARRGRQQGSSVRVWTYTRPPSGLPTVSVWAEHKVHF